MPFTKSLQSVCDTVDDTTARKEAMTMSQQIRRALVLAVLVVVGAAVVPAVQAATTQAPTFTLELFNGQSLRLADLKGTAVILLFWANW